MTRIAEVGRDAAGSLGARIVAMACSSVTALLVANALTKTEYGGYSIVLGIGVLVVMGLDIGLTSALARFVAQGRSTDSLVLRVAGMRLAITGVGAVVIAFAAVVPWVRHSSVGHLLWWLALLVVTQSLLAFQFGLLPSLRRIDVLLFVTVAQPVGELALVLWARAHDATAAGMLRATVISGALVVAVAWTWLLAPGRLARADVPAADDERSVASLARVVAYGRSIFLVSVLIAAFGQVDQFVIGWFHPLAAVAPYAVVIKLQALVTAPATTLSGIVAPRIAGAGHHALSMYRRWLVFLANLNLGGVVVLCVLAPEVFRAIGGQYHDAWPILLGMSAFLVMCSIAPLPSITLNQVGHAGARRRIAAWTVLVNLVLDLALVPSLGAWGAAIGTTVAYAYYFVSHDRIVTGVLARDADPAPHRISPALALGAGMSAAMGVLAAGLRAGIVAVVAHPSPLVVLAIAAGVPALVHVAWCVRRLRS